MKTDEKVCSCFYFPIRKLYEVKQSFCYNCLILHVKKCKTRHVKGECPTAPSYLLLGC